MKAILVAVVLSLPGAALAGNPAPSASPSTAPATGLSINAPHPSMPWSGVANPYGQVMRYIVMPGSYQWRLTPPQFFKK